MRVDHVGASMNVQAKPVAQSLSSDRKIEPVKEQISTDHVKSSAKKLEEQHLEARIAAEKDAAEKEHDVIKAIEKANKHIRTYDRRLEFSIHDMTKQIMVKVIDTENDSVIREIPSEKVLDMVAHLWEVAGILVDERK